MKLMKDTTIEDLRAGEKYISFKFEMGLTDVQNSFCFDQSKANLLYLVEPRVDTEGIAAARDNPIAADIDERMDGPTWWELKKLPLTFLEYWLGVDIGITALAEHWPPNYRTLMTERAHAAQKRLLGVVEDGNVVRLDFPRSLLHVKPHRDGSPNILPTIAAGSETIGGIPSEQSPKKILGNFVDNGDGTVTDSRTGLMWTRYVLGQTWDGSKPVGNWRDYSWREAVALRHSFAGHDDWRLPTVDELAKIVEPNHSPPFNRVAFPNAMPFGCWTISPHDENPRNAWSVDFKTGARVCRDRSESHLVRLVRNGQSVTTSGLVETTALQFQGQTELPTRTVTTERIDSVIAASIEQHGVPFALEAAARASTIGGEFFFRTVVLCGLECGLFRLPATETGKYPNSNPEIKAFLSLVSEKTSSLRKAASKYVRYAWLATSNGHAVDQCATVQQLKRAAQPMSEQPCAIEQQPISSSAEEQATGDGLPESNSRDLQLDSVAQGEPVAVASSRVAASEPIFRVDFDHALSIVRTAVDLLTRHPEQFSREAAELRVLLSATSNDPSAPGTRSNPFLHEVIPGSVATPVTVVLRWLVDFDSISFAELRSKLLPLDLLPAAVIDAINERALDLTGEIALEHIDDDVVVCRETLADVLRAAE